MFSRDQLKRVDSLTEEDFVQLARCRRPHNRLGFAYQVAFVRLLGRFPQQQPFELFEELVCFSAAQFGLDAGLIEFYRRRQPTISERQQTITGYRGSAPSMTPRLPEPDPGVHRLLAGRAKSPGP